jgi:hypothetical protein
MPITLGHLEMSKAYLVPIPIPSTGCQYGVLELQNLIVDDLLSSNISTDGGQWTFYMDSMGGLVDLSLQTPLYQSLEWSIRADTSVIETIEVPLSRNLATNLRLEPCQLQDSLLSQTINVLFWIPQISSSIGFREVSPGILAILQKSYKSVHFGLLPSDLTSTTPTFYIEEDIADFISSVEQQCFVTPNNPLNLRLLSGALKKVRWTSNARRFLVVISNNPSISYTLNDIVQLQDTFMDQNILPNFLVAVGKDEKYVDMLKNMQFGTLKVFSRPDELPVKLNESFLENDNATPFVFTLMDTNQLVDSLVVLPPAAPYSLPSLSVLLRTLSDNYVPTSSIRIVILG